MKVYFIGAGPGAVDLITLRGAKILGKCKMVLYAGSLIPEDMLQHCQSDAELLDTSKLDLEQQQACYQHAKLSDIDVARLHSGDPAIYGATAEQMHRLDIMGIDYEIIPGVSSFSAAAAAINAELTKPAISQSIILTRVSGRASAVPELESIDKFAQHKATMCIFLSGPHLKKIVGDLLLHYPATTPVALIYRATWPEQKHYKGTLKTILQDTIADNWNLTTMLLVGSVLDEKLQAESSLYDKNFTHIFRVPKKILRPHHE